MNFSQIASATTKIAAYTRFIGVGIKPDDKIEPVKKPEPGISSEIVEIALEDAENLIKNSGAIIAVDRVHTALHGYFKAVCLNSNIEFNENANLITLWGLIRQNHPAFDNSTNKNDDIIKMLRNISTIIDSINNIRNKSSVAHPNENLLNEPEAMLAINLARSILHYVDSLI